MPSFNRRPQNQNNLVFLTPSTSSNTNKNKNQYRQRINSLPAWSKQSYSSTQSNVNENNIHLLSDSHHARKRRSEGSIKSKKDVVFVVDDEPGNKKRKLLSAGKGQQPSVLPYFDLVSNFFH